MSIFYTEIAAIITNGQKNTYKTINKGVLETYWLVGKHIVEEEQNGKNKAEYGKNIIGFLSEKLTQEFGKGYSEASLRYIRQFYIIFPICHALRDELSWTHYRFLLKVENPKARTFYINESIDNQWDTRSLERQINSFYVARQKRLSADNEHFYIDLVFYNYILKCFVLIDLKMGKLTHQDIGQMDFYVRMWEDLCKTEGDNPTIGIILCSEKNDIIVKYSVLENNTQLFASKYMLYLPTETELMNELSREKNFIETEENFKRISYEEKLEKLRKEISEGRLGEKEELDRKREILEIRRKERLRRYNEGFSRDDNDYPSLV